MHASQFVCICTGNSTKNRIVSSQLLKRARATPQQAPRWSPGGPGAPRLSQLTSGLKTRIFAPKSPKWRYRAQKSLKMHAYTMTPLVQVTSLSDEKCDCIRSFSGVSALIQTLRIKNKKNISLTHLLVFSFFSANYLLLSINVPMLADGAFKGVGPLYSIIYIF